MEHIWTVGARQPGEAQGRLRPRAEEGTPLPRLRSRPALDREEQTIRATLLSMLDLIGARVGLTIDALEGHDAALALTVIEGDAQINALAATALEQVVWTIATQSPVARDLRFLLTLDRLASEIERIGDSIANVAKRVREIAPEPALADYLGIPAMGRLVAQILADVRVALANADAGAARAIARQDDAIDACYHGVSAQLIALSQASSLDFGQASRLLIAAHYLERIGDRATNIAEGIVFLVTGEHEDLNP